jgi:recombination protein RecR
MNLKITQLAYGVPVGSEIHYLDDNTLGAALESRKNLS